MGDVGADVVWTEEEPGRVPDGLTRGAALLLDLAGGGRLATIADRLRIRREGGYAGVDVLVFLLLYFLSAERSGLRRFWDKCRPLSQALAALAGRKSLPSTASVSRALGQVDLDMVRSVGPWLLGEGSGIDALLTHPSVMAFNALGQGCMVLDYDPTVHALRQRALPENRDGEDDLPDALPKAEQIGSPGYGGRKRGDVQFRRCTLQHAGSGAWLGLSLFPGSTGRAEGLHCALDVIVTTCKRLDWPLDRCMLRMDGEFGWVPYFLACRSRGVPFVTRLNRPELLDDPVVRQRLDNAVWHLVDDSRAGPQRSATDLGIVSIPPGKNTRAPDGTEYPPVDVRVVVCRFPRSGKANHGRVISGWQYELFVVDADVGAWPAAAAVTLYFGRSGQENRFAQEDRELALDRIFSYHPPGQELAAVIGLWSWNLRIARGFLTSPPPVITPTQAPAAPTVDTRQAPPLATAAIGSPTEGLASAEPPPPTPEVTAPPDLHALLAELDWPNLLTGKPAWRWDGATGDLVGTDGRRLTLSAVISPLGHGPLTILEFQDRGPSQELSTNSGRPNATKPLRLPVHMNKADQLRQALRGPPRPPAHPTAAPPKDPPPPVPNRPRAFRIEDLEGQRGHLKPVHALFLPAKARQAFDQTVERCQIIVDPPVAQKARSSSPLVAASVEARQHRRLTWNQHLERYALPRGQTPKVAIRGGDGLRSWMRACGRLASGASL